MKRRIALALGAVAALACGAEAPGRESTPSPMTASVEPASAHALMASELPDIATAGFASTPSTPWTPLPSVQDTAGTMTRRIWGQAELGSVSPDGRYVSITDWQTGDLAVRDLENGEIRYLTRNPEPYDPGMADAHKISRDGKWVAYTWSTGAFPTPYELRVLSADGGEPRVICCDAFSGWMFPLDWSTDGRWVLVGRELQPERELVLISTEDGSVRSLKTFEDPSPGGFPRQASLSPDGRFLAYDYLKDGESTDYDIYVMEIATLREHVLVESPAFDGLLGWAPDGNHILFQSDRGGTPGAWLLPVADGVVSGPPWLVKPDLWRARGVGFAGDGRYFYLVETGKVNVFVAPFDAEAMKVAGSATPVTPRRLGNAIMPSWSPDGRLLLYGAETGPLPVQYQPWVSRSVVIQSLETGAVRELSLGVPGEVFPIGWTSDGRGVLAMTKNLNDPEGAYVLYRMDVQTTERRVLYRVAPGRSVAAGLHLGPDGRSLFMAMDPVAPVGSSAPGVSGNQRGSYQVVREDLETGEVAVLFQTPPGGPGQIRGFALSPDGETLAVGYCPRSGPHWLVLLPTEGGPARELLEGTFNSIAWMPNGEGLLTYGSLGQDTHSDLYSVGLPGGETEPVGISAEGLVSQGNLLKMDVHPDGDRVVYTAGQPGFELWVMEDFLPGPGG